MWSCGELREEDNLSFPIGVKIKYTKVREEIKLDPQIFAICEIRREEFKKLFFLSKKIYFIHKLPDYSFDVLEIIYDEPKRYKRYQLKPRKVREVTIEERPAWLAKIIGRKRRKMVKEY